MYEKVKRYVEKNDMLRQSDHVITGVSGGADSICLLCMLIKLREEYNLAITAVHIHHGLRGADADADENYVKEFCERQKIPLEIRHIDVAQMAKETGLSEEEAGRIARREAFEEVLGQVNGTKIALAHHMNDNAETLFHNIARGTGLRGLVGMRPVNGVYIRPMLCVKREEIEDYLRKNNIKYCIDQTNFHDTYTRNRIRNHILPYMEREVNGKVVEHAGELMNQMRSLYTYVETQVEAYYRICTKEEDGILVKEEAFLSVPEALQPYLIQMILKKVSEKEQDIEEIHLQLFRELFEKQVGKRVSLPYHMTAFRTYDGVRLKKMNEKDESEESGQSEKEEICGDISFRIFENDGLHKAFPQKTYTKWFDYDIIKNSLVIRNRRAGDRIVIDKQGGTQKIKDYFINEKIPREERDRIWLLADENDILWVVGYRQSRKYQVTERTKQILEIRINGGKTNGRIYQSIGVGRRNRKEN